MFIDSSILNKDHKKEEHFKLLRDNLEYPSRLKLLFRASEHRFSAKTFHEYCNYVPDTFTIVETEFGKIIGGFSHYRWNAVKSGAFVEDAERRAFLLSFSLGERIDPLYDYFLIGCE